MLWTKRLSSLRWRRRASSCRTRPWSRRARGRGGGPADAVHAGEWVFSRAWIDELRRELDARLDAADPLDPGIDAPAEPWAPEIVPLLGLERRGSRLYRRGAAGELGARAAEADRVVDALTG